MKKASIKKVRFDGLDVLAMTSYLNKTILGSKVSNIYDGISKNTFCFKLQGILNQDDDDIKKAQLLLESGIRFHVTKYQDGSINNNMPSNFTMKLRKHLRNLRIEHIRQLGNLDRVVDFTFGNRYHLVLELYAKGNIVLCDANYEILALLRTVDLGKEKVKVAVGQVYPVTFTTTISNDHALGFRGNKQQIYNWIVAEITNNGSKGAAGKKVKSMRHLLNKPTSGVFHYGPSLIEHCIDVDFSFDKCGNLDDVKAVLSEEDLDKLIESLDKEGVRIINELSSGSTCGYIMYQDKDKVQSDDTTPHSDKILTEFQPHVLKQHTKTKTLEYTNFSKAVDDFFSLLESQKLSQKAQAAEVAAQTKLEKIKLDQQDRIKSLEEHYNMLKKHAELVELHAIDIDKALLVINSALDNGMDWDSLTRLIQLEQERQNPIAKLIHELDLKNEAILLILPDYEDEETLKVRVLLNETAYGNARILFEKYRTAKEKSCKTVESLSKALQNAELQTKKQLKEVQKMKNINVKNLKQSHWFQKFYWFITSDNYLVLAGRDAQQNELLVKRYLREGDVYFHADVHGASSCILRAKRRRNKSKTVSLPLPELALQQAANFTICLSSAWSSKIVTSAWYVQSHQVSKTAPSGEYLTPGSFMIRGKKTFMKPTALEMGFGVLFRLGDKESIGRHLNDRRDHSLVEFEEGLDVIQEDVPQDLDTATEVLIDNHNFNEEPNEQIEEPKQTKKLSPKEKKLVYKHGSLEAAQQMKKGLSVKDRKLIRKYGCLEKAHRILQEQEQANDEISVLTQETNAPEKLPRGKKSKLKKIAKKYADQDEEDRALALLALHGGEKQYKKKKKKGLVSDSQRQAAIDTAHLLMKDSSCVVDTLEESVRELLTNCVLACQSDLDITESNGSSIVWNDYFDFNVLETLSALTPIEAQMAAVNRMYQLVSSKNVDNLSASLSGIIRTIKKYGHAEERLEDNEAKSAPKEDVEEEENEEDISVLDDTTELSKFTGKPTSEDVLPYAIPCIAPYQSLSTYKYRVKLTPGSLKRGKASKQCLELFLQNNEDKRNKELMKQITDNELVQAMIGNVKLSAPGVSKALKKMKSKKT